MTELFRIVEPPRRCSYLPTEKASLEIRGVADMTPEKYADLLSRGYRRFGVQVFRPRCRACSQCRSVRVLVRDFEPDASQRRVLRKNAQVRAELHPLFVSAEHIGLYNRYHRFMTDNRGWPAQSIDVGGYYSEFLSGAATHGRQWLYFFGQRLIGVALMDEVPDAVSLVYCFYDPDWRAQSPGTFSILNQILYAQRRGYAFAYLGYWVAACPSMTYKGKYHPRQMLERYPADVDMPLWSTCERE